MYFFLPGNSSGGGGSSTGAGALTVVSPEKKKIEEYYKNLLWDWFFLKSKNINLKVLLESLSKSWSKKFFLLFGLPKISNPSVNSSLLISMVSVKTEVFC